MTRADGTFNRIHAELLERDLTIIEEQLTAFAQRTQSDLMVAGRYGHSRIRELVLVERRAA